MPTVYVLCCNSFSIISAMYQAEIMPDLEKLARSLTYSNIQEVTSPGAKSVSQSAECKKETHSVNSCHVSRPTETKCHNDTLKHPSEILIEFKVCLLFS